MKAYVEAVFLIFLIFSIQDGKEIKDRVKAYVEAGELTAADEFILMNWLDNYKVCERD